MTDMDKAAMDTLQSKTSPPRDLESRAAAALYFGKVMHARTRPKAHRFTYRVMSLLIDLERLDDADRQSKLFAVNRRGIYSFHEADHGHRDGTSLLAFAQEKARAAHIDLSGGRVVLLCYPRLFGYAFNPLSIYYCYNASGALVLLIHEVRNTFGGIHHYVHAPGMNNATMPDLDDAPIRHSATKAFFVSPFIEMPMTYHFTISPPGHEVSLRILETDKDGPLLVAAFKGGRRALTTASLIASLLSLPLVTFKVFAAIHWEALRLYWKGVRLVPRPAPHIGKGVAHEPVASGEASLHHGR